jgi:serine/threonine protein kinase
MELCEYDLRKEIKQGKMSEEKCVRIFVEVIRGLKLFVENSYIHRDLKPENIFVKNNKYKIGDFGFAVKADLYCKQKLEDVCGTPIYMAPELLNNQPYSAKCDIWSLGLILYEMIYGCTPWPVKCLDHYRAILSKRPLAFPFDVRIGKDTKDFLKKTIVVD